MFHDTHIHLEMLLDSLKMSNFREEMEIFENSLWQNSKDLEPNLKIQNQKSQNLSNNSTQIETNLSQYFDEYFDKINQIQLTNIQKSKIEELFQNHEFAIHSTVNFANFGLVYQLFSDFPKIKFLFGAHPEIVNESFDLKTYLINQQNFLKIWTQKQTKNSQNQSQNKQISKPFLENIKPENTNLHSNSVSKKLNSLQKIIGIGEIGLDYFYTKDQNLIKTQQKLFESQIELSQNFQSKVVSLGLQKNSEEGLESQEIKETLLILELENNLQSQIQSQNSQKYFQKSSQNNLQDFQTLQNFANEKNKENGNSNQKNLPIVIHCREAFGDLIAILKNFPEVHGNFLVHCWTGNVDELRQILDLGVIVAFGGILTYKSAESLRVAAEFCPIDRLVLETDLPFLSPQNNRSKICLPEFINETCEKLAQIKKVEKSLIWQKSLENTRNLFGEF